MYYTSILIVLIYFGVGALGIWTINRKKTEEKRERWIKYLTYLFITFTVILCIHYGYFHFLAAFISLIGIKEVVEAKQNSPTGNNRFPIVALLVYLLLAFIFFWFSFGESDELLFVYTIVLTFDGFSQISGQLFGKTPLVKKISPNKTIEGLAGGVVISLLTALILPFGSALENLFPAWLIIVGALSGDLLASWYKRRCGIKDYSNLIPGHGGMLDRFDSFMLAAVFYTILFVFI